MFYITNNLYNNNFYNNNFYNFFKKKKNLININPLELYANNSPTTTYFCISRNCQFAPVSYIMEAVISNITAAQFTTLKIFESIFLNFKFNLNIIINPHQANLTSYNYFLQKKIFINNTKSYKFTYFSYVSSSDDIIINKLLLNSTNSINNIQPEMYLKNEEKLLQLIDNKIWKQVTTKKSFFYTNCDLYEFNNLIPFTRNLKLNEILYVNLNWLSFFSFNDNLATYDLASSFYYEPFFFFWEKIQQSMLEFRMISHYRARALLFDDRVYKPTITANDPNHIFPLLSHLSHSSDFKAGYKILKRLFDYKNDHKFSYYLDFEDIQNYAIDKNFVHLWNYWIGVYDVLNIFDIWGWTSLMNFFREWISSPKLHFDSKFYWTDNSYGSYATWVVQFGFFPDFAMLWGQFNPQFDWMTSGYNRFFHFGENFMDSSIALDSVWFQLTENYWGDFEYIVEDYAAYQSTYFPDNVATIRLPIILLATKNYPTPAEMTLRINDYNNVFMFKQIKQYENLWTDIFFELDRLDRLKLLRDGPPIDQWVFHIEKIISLYFAYNSSNFISNQPNWLTSLTDPYDFYSTLIYDINEDLKLEDWEWGLINSLSAKNYDYSSNPSIYFTKNNFNQIYFNLPLFLSEKIFDDAGYFNSSINWGSEYKNLSNFDWLNKFSLIHLEYLPTSHFTWKITILGSNPFEWDFLTPFYDKITLYKIFTALKQSFSFSYLIMDYSTTFEYKDKFYPATIKLPTFCFEFTFQPLIIVFWDFCTNNTVIRIFEFLLHWIMSVPVYIFPIYNFITIDSLNQKINYIFDKFSNIDNYYLTKTLAYTENFINLPLIKFLNQKINYIFNYFLIFFLSYEHFDVQIHIYWNDNNNQIKIALDKVDISIKPLPLEFYIPFFKYPTSEYLITRLSTSVKISDSIILPDLTILTLEDDLAIERFVIFWSLLSLSNDNIWTENIEDTIKIINQLDYNLMKKKSLDYDWYINYSVKKTLYKKIK